MAAGALWRLQEFRKRKLVAKDQFDPSSGEVEARVFEFRIELDLGVLVEVFKIRCVFAMRSRADRLIFESRWADIAQRSVFRSNKGRWHAVIRSGKRKSAPSLVRNHHRRHDGVEALGSQRINHAVPVLQHERASHCDGVTERPGEVDLEALWLVIWVNVVKGRKA